jgi:Na+/melibiose symporter-like transporter
MLVNAVGYGFSGICALLMRAVPALDRPDRRNFRAELVEGVQAVVRDPMQLRLASTAITSNFFAVAILALYVLYATQVLHLMPLLVGVSLAAGALGAVAMAFAMSYVASRLTPRVSIMSGLAVSAAGYLLMPALNGRNTVVSVVGLSLASFFGQGGLVLVRARAMAWRQEITPVHLLGRVVAVNRTAAFGVLPVSALLAGVVADTAGIRLTLMIGALGMLAACLWLIAPLPAAQHFGGAQKA